MVVIEMTKIEKQFTTSARVKYLINIVKHIVKSVLFSFEALYISKSISV